MNDDSSWLASLLTTSNTNRVITALIASAALMLVLRLFAKTKSSNNKTKAVPQSHSTQHLAPVWQILIDFFVLAFLLWQLAGSVYSQAPITRMDVFAIAFWTWFALAYAMEVAFFRNMRSI